MSISLVRTQTPLVATMAVIKNGLSLKHVNHKLKRPQLCKLAVQNNCQALQYVDNQTEEICLIAVKKCGGLLLYVHNQTHDICLAAVKQNWKALKYVEDKTPNIIAAAEEQNPNALSDVAKIARF